MNVTELRTALKGVPGNFEVLAGGGFPELVQALAFAQVSDSGAEKSWNYNGVQDSRSNAIVLVTEPEDFFDLDEEEEGESGGQLVNFSL
jgi:hypothetical protein